MKLLQGLMVILLFLSGIPMLSGQKVLLLEKVNTTKSIRYLEGQSFHFRLNGDDEFREATLQQLIMEDSILVLDRQYVKLDDIAAIRSYKNREWSRLTGLQLYFFGAGWGLFTLGDELASNTYRADWEMAGYVAAGSLITGWAIQKIFHHKNYPLGKKRRLRILDLRPIR